MKSLRLLLILIAVAGLSISALAQDEEEKWRNFEVTLNGGLTNPTSALTDWKDSLGAKLGFHLGGSGGFYFTNRICTGLYFSFAQMGMEGDWERNFKSYDFGGYLKYAFAGESNFEPYLKLSGGAVWPKYPIWVSPAQNKLREQSFDPGFGMAGYLGLLYYTSDYGGIFFEFGYHNDFLDGTETDYQGEIYTIEDDISYMDFRAGITVFFGPED
ncbi:MAG: outer membrane beta-barrel protein [Candidatus Zixiibacteriota bacterium]|nr:MAG: outer membrane beta-barrel protein [candidate division Zixibacteria bacterium]